MFTHTCICNVHVCICAQCYVYWLELWSYMYCVDAVWCCLRWWCVLRVVCLPICLFIETELFIPVCMYVHVCLFMPTLIRCVYVDRYVCSIWCNSVALAMFT